MDFVLFNMKMHWTPKNQLSDLEVRTSLQMITREGLTSEAMLCLSSGAVLVAIALSLGASNFQIGLLAAFPTLTNLAQLFSIYLLSKFPNRKIFTVSIIFLARWPLIILGIFLFTDDFQSIQLLLIAMFAHYFLNSLGGAGWNAWVKDLVPENSLGAYFGKRSRYMQMTNVFFSLIVAFLIDFVYTRFPEYLSDLYASYFIISGLIGILGTYFLARAFDTKIEIGSENLFSLLKIPLQNKNFRKLLIFIAAWSFAVNLAVPFFTVYMLQNLGLSMLWVMILATLTQIFSIFTIRNWGNLSDRYSNKSIIFLAAPLYILCLLGWIFVGIYTSQLLNILLLIVLHIVTGVSTSGINLALTNIGLKLAPKQDALIFISIKNIVTSLFSALAPIVGGLFADFFVTRNLRITFEWISPNFVREFRLVYLHDWNFLFLFASFFALISLRALIKVEENGEVSHYLVRKVLKTRFKQQFKHNLIVGNISQFHAQMKAIIKRKEKMERMEANQNDNITIP